MFPVVAARPPARNIKLFEIKARRIARKQRPGQFVIIRLDDTGERVPLTIADANHKPGPSPLSCRPSARPPALNMLEAGDSILDSVGPLGEPSEIENFGTAVIISAASVQRWLIRQLAS